MTESLEDLLTKLKNLRVQEEIVIQKIDHALQQSRLQEESVIKQIEDLTEKHSKKSNLKTPATASVPETTKARVLQPASDRKKRVLDFKTDFKRGDRVTIKNRTTSSIFNRRASIEDKTATVTRVRIDENGRIEKVFITTYNGLATHRLPKHLEHLNKLE